ncbi:MAG: proprotein convertase P-domain-containing protein [Acidimicrobiales bacterium]
MQLLSPTDEPRRRSGSHRRAGAALAAVGVIAALLAPTVATAVPTTTTVSYTGPAVPIPDAADLSGTMPGAAATATLPVAGLAGPITDVDVRFDGASCSATAGSTTVGLDHTFVNDLEITLTSPDGTSVLLINNTDGGGNNLCQTVLDDEATLPIQGVVTANAPFTGSFTPNAPLAGFDGGPANGSWTLTAQDFFSQDTGNIRAFSLIITTEPIAVAATKTVSGTLEEGGTVTYTIVQTNSGVADALDNAGDELTDVLPADLTLVSATATSGTATATIGTNTVTWNGSTPAGGSVTLTVTATVDTGTENRTIGNQAALAFDSDSDGDNESTALSDDPAVAGAADPTSFTVAGIPPTVTVEQGVSQPDPAVTSPIVFRVVFSEPVTGFTGSDVTLAGTAGPTTATVTGSGAAYDVSVSGMAGAGTVTASLAGGVASDAAGNLNVASASGDNTVTFAPADNATTTTSTTSTTATTGTPATTTTTVAVSGAALPATGGDAGRSTAIALTLVLLGAGLVGAAAHRRTRHDAR